MSHWSLITQHDAGWNTPDRADMTRSVLSSRHADEGAWVVIAEPQNMGTPRRDVWSREAERLRKVAAQAGYPLDEDEIRWLDLHVLRAQRIELERAGRRARMPRSVLHWFSLFGGVLIRKVTGAR